MIPLTNLPGLDTARTLHASHGRLGASVERLSSGLRVNCTDDDAGAPACREPMRTDIGALQQGVRTPNDAIFLIQAPGGALTVIREIKGYSWR